MQVIVELLWSWRWQFPELQHPQWQKMALLLWDRIKMTALGMAAWEFFIKEFIENTAIGEQSDLYCLLG